MGSSTLRRLAPRQAPLRGPGMDHGSGYPDMIIMIIMIFMAPGYGYRVPARYGCMHVHVHVHAACRPAG